MNEIIFYGVVHPERASVTIPSITQKLFDLDGKPLGDFTVEISHAQVTAHLATQIDNLSLESWRNSLQPRIEAIVDGLGFLLGCGYEVEIKSAYELATKKSMVFPVRINVLPTCGSYQDALKKLETLYQLTQHEFGPFFVTCLADLRQAIRRPFYSSFYCFRAVESLRNLYCVKQGLDPDRDKAKSWQILRDDLALTENSIKNNIQEFAKEIRHGGIRQFSEEERTQILTTAWDIVHRFADKYPPKPNEN